MRQVYLLDQDVSHEIISVAEITVNAGDFGQLTINDLPSMVGNNQRGFWDQTNQASPFYGARELSRYTIEIINNGVRVFQGAIHSIKSNNQKKTANITLKSDIQKKLEKGLIYSSADNSNPATMVQELCSAYKIPINASSFARASSIYEIDLVRTSAYFLNEGTIESAIQQILEIGIGRVYSQYGVLYYDVFTNKTVTPIFTATDIELSGVTLYSHPEVTTVEKEPLSGYKVEYVNGVASFGNSEEHGKTISGNGASTVRIMTHQSAVWIGEKWLDYFGTKQETVNFSISANFGRSFGIGDPIGIEYRERSYTVDIVSINKSKALETVIGGITR